MHLTSADPAGNPLESLGTLHVVGGSQRNRQGMRELDEQWYGYGKGVVVEVGSGPPTTVLEHRSAPGTCGPDDPELLKSATLVGDRLYACSQTELMVFSYPSFGLLHHVSHPVLNDVHHVVPGLLTEAERARGDEPNLWVAVSGQDMVAEFTVSGELVSVWGVDGSDPTDRIDPDRDYRINTRLKPHEFHPNHLFRLPDGSLWVNRFETRDAVEVGTVGRRMVIGRERCHDGVVHDGLVHFTTVDGWVVAIDAETLRVVAEYRLTGFRENTLRGWCRGLTFVDDFAIVGFSRIRHTKVRGALSWVRNGLTQTEPTRIAVYDRRSWRLEQEIDLEPAGCNAVFSILSGRVG